MLLKNRASGFVSNVATLVTGTTVGSSIRLLLTPIVARLFFPEHFGVAALFISIATITSTIGSLRYDQAVVLPKEDSEALGIASLSFVILLLFSALVFCLALSLTWLVPDFSWLQTLGKWSFALPIVVFLYGFASILTFWHMRKKRFKHLAGSQISMSSMTSGSRIVFGISSGSSVSGLILSVFLGLISRIAALLIGFDRTEFKPLFKLRRSELIASAKKYKDFPLYTAPTDLLRIFARNLPVLMLAFMFSSRVVGFYALASRLVRMPVELVSESVRRAYYQKSSELKNDGSALKASLIKITVALAVLGIPPFLTVFLFGETIFTFLLGAEWATAGKYAGILAPFFFAVFVNAPASAILVVLRKQALLLHIHIWLVVCTAALFITCHVKGATPEYTLFLFSLINMLFVLGIMTAAIKTAIREDRHLELEIQGTT
jgi:O-antigen/teichoic acid export membrane protein